MTDGKRGGKWGTPGKIVALKCETYDDLFVVDPVLAATTCADKRRHSRREESALCRKRVSPIIMIDHLEKPNWFPSFEKVSSFTGRPI